MKTYDISVDEMERRFVRFANLKPRSSILKSMTGIAPEVSQFLAADRNYGYMAPKMEQNSAITSTAAMIGGDAGDCISLSILFCKPGKGPPLHNHGRTTENFFCLKGKFELTFGNRGENRLPLETHDLVSVPPGVMRRFCNTGDDEAALLVVIQGRRDQFNDIEYAPQTAAQIREKFGDEALETVKRAGRKFLTEEEISED